jgi:membrane protein DedA with SNARE-associated domain
MGFDIDQLVRDYGHAGIIAFLISTGCGCPLPEEVALIAAGIAAANGLLDPWACVLSCMVGCLVGDSLMYFIGRRLGKRLLRPGSFWTNYITPDREKMFERLIHRHGAKVLFFARFLVGVRTPIYLTTGILKYPYRKFILIDSVCALLVVMAFFWLSYFWGNEAVNFIRQAEYGLTIVVVVGAVIAGIFAWVHFGRKKKPYDPGALGKLLGEDAQSIATPQNVCETKQNCDLSEPMPENSQN